jgi:hypothetical protein
VEGAAEHIPAVGYPAARHPTAVAVDSAVPDPTADAVGAVGAVGRRIAGVLGERWGCIDCALPGCSLRRTARFEVGERGIAIAVVDSFLGEVVEVGCSRRLKSHRRVVEVT